MLTELRIANFAVIEELSLQFSKGFTVLTGETGAGKSILIDAISLLLGGRASIEQIRSGSEETLLEASFDLPRDSPLLARLRSREILDSGEHELIIRRVINRSGRNRIHLNGKLMSAHSLEELAGTLVDIHGQHDQQSLLSANVQLEVLDAFGHLSPLREQFRQAYERWKSRRHELEEVQRRSADRLQREDFLRFQYKEIEEANIQPGEEERLVAELRRLAHAHRLTELTQAAYSHLYGGDQSLLSGLGAVDKDLRALSEIDADAKDWASLCEDAAIQLKELAARLRAYRDGLDQDPERLAHVEQRVEQLQRLKKKYGGSVAAVVAFGEDLRRQIDGADHTETRTRELQKWVEEDREEIESLAIQLSKKRRQSAARLAGEVAEQLAALRMEQHRFEMAVDSQEGDASLTSMGRDRVQCLLSANRGEPLHPLARVASGGELSRVMLAMKTVLAETDRVPVLIFDEVDAGIGGAVAAIMGTRLKKLADYHQVLCVTHLPQVAAQADQHLVVEKSTKDGRTLTSVRTLTPSGRQEEVARMLGGLTVTRKVRETAAELIKSGRGRR
ncbi:MAG: DNA repair protein RecN [Nitrospiraceae bacterium]